MLDSGVSTGIAAVNADTMHRTAKYFMDSGRVSSHEEAVDLLRDFVLHIKTGPEVRCSRDHQIALLTLVNLARRTFLGGIFVEGMFDAPLLVPLADQPSLREAVRELGGLLVEDHNTSCPRAYVGSVEDSAGSHFGWQLTWDGWRGGVVPIRDRRRLSEKGGTGLAAAFAATACAAEAFLFHAGDHPLAGLRSSGLSLWNPGSDWLEPDESEVRLQFLPAALWLIGLGNLGQAYLWILTSLPYANPREVQFLLQDYDRITAANESTSVLTNIRMVGAMKTRALGEWLENRGFRVAIEERRFGEWSRRAPHEPAVALCGVDNAVARAALERAGFELVIEAGLGGGTQAFRNFSLHTFPSSLKASKLWMTDGAEKSTPMAPAYSPDKLPGLDQCGIVQLASRAIAVPFVGMAAASLAVSELLRRLHNGRALELASGSVTVLDDIETVQVAAEPYGFGHVSVLDEAGTDAWLC